MSVHFIALLHSHARYVSHACADGTSAWQHTISCARALMDSGWVSECTLLCVSDHELEQDGSDVFTQRRSIANCMHALVKQLCELAGSDTHLCLMFADAMISYEPLYAKMIEMHQTYVAHYTRGEGYPEAITPEILSPIACRLLQSTLSELEAGGAHDAEVLPIERGALFSLVERRINDYDIEALLAPEDMRMLRTSLAADTRSNFTVAKQLWDEGLRDPDHIMNFYREKPQLFRCIPRYVYVQLTDAVQPVVYDPHYAMVQEQGDILAWKTRAQCRSMHDDVWRAVVSKVSEYAEDAILTLGFGGEIALHPHVFSYIDAAAATFPCVYLETNGYEWNVEDSWWDAVPSNVSWIVYLDAHSDELYGALWQGADCGGPVAQEAKARAHAFVEMLLVKTYPRNVFVQATRMVENEGELDMFCRHWEQKGAQPIIQKYNDVCGMLPNRKTVDLAPVHRFACRHLERDMLVDLDGRVRMCFQDLRRQHMQGSVVNDTIETLWKHNERLFVQQVQGHYEGMCRSCDEYYTCNV